MLNSQKNICGAIVQIELFDSISSHVGATEENSMVIHGSNVDVMRSGLQINHLKQRASPISLD